MVSKSEYNIKGVLLAAGGLIILLLPKILTNICPLERNGMFLTFSLRLFGPDSYFFRKKTKEKIGEG